MDDTDLYRLKLFCLPLAGAAPAVLFLLGWILSRHAAELDTLRPSLAEAAARAEASLANRQEALELKTQDLGQLRSTLAGLAKSKAEAYVSSISLQEEKRLLEKQAEILSTSLLLDPQTSRVSLMRGGQAARGFPVGNAFPIAVGAITGQPPGGRVVSKERFAGPKRSRYEEKNGAIQWEPQEEGSSLRSSALGEYVLFVQGGLILHGPSKLKADHDAYPHFCLNLPLETAKGLYNAAFIGTRIAVPAQPKTSAQPAARPVEPAVPAAAKPALPAPSAKPAAPAPSPKPPVPAEQVLEPGSSN